MLRRILTCSFLFLTCLPWSALALDLTPFSIRNFSPPAMIKGLPVAETPRLNAPGQLSTRFGLDVSNIATDNSSSDEAIVLDGETYVATLGLRFGLADHLQVGVDLPWVWQKTGFLDGFIENFHNLFGFPNADRDNLPKYKINYDYSHANGDDFQLGHQTNGIGDIRLIAAWQWLDTEQSAASLQAAIKAPTGDAGDFTGSGGWDVSLALSAQRDFALEKGMAALWGGLGGSWLGDGDVLQDRVENWAVSGWLGAGWSPLNWLALKVQLDGNSALYQSGLREIGNPAVLLTVGGTLGLGEATTLDIGLGEDLAVTTAPDAIFHFSLNHKF
jgi:hypothetical protein